ncbi:MAG: ABC transporter ATP-binding protein [Candidatus Hecatellales archaeon]|nr:MAG: ABC transporter ATP-binding protein [Candidatus Hecatellales archaeon]
MSSLLQVDQIDVFYGRSQALYKVSMRVEKGEIVVLLGRNGVGKTTTIKTVMGLLKPKSGRIFLEGRDVTGLPAFKIFRSGVGYVPQGKRLFPKLSVAENLRIGLTVPGRGEGAPFDKRLKEMLALFPYLEDKLHRPAGTLSGGEQQMLAIARALITEPKLLLMDEPSEGLMPLLIEKLGDTIASINKKGVTVLLAEQNAPMALRVAHRVYIMDNGRIVYEGKPGELLQDEAILIRYLGVKL